MFAPLRGYAPYWQNVKEDLVAHILCFGTPTWFLTLNPNEKDWQELHDTYTAIYKLEEKDGIVKTDGKVNRANIYSFVQKDPVIFSRFMHRRIHLIFNFLKTSKALGEIIHRFYRIEYRQSGAHHVHAFLWIKGITKKAKYI
jgi:hypothetical protein